MYFKEEEDHDELNVSMTKDKIYQRQLWELVHSYEGYPWSKWRVINCGEMISGARKWSKFELSSKRSITSPKKGPKGDHDHSSMFGRFYITKGGFHNNITRNLAIDIG